MVHTAILGRRLDVPVINLGFSGNGKMEAEVTELLAELEVTDIESYAGTIPGRMMAEILSKIPETPGQPVRATRPPHPWPLWERGRSILRSGPGL